MGSKKQIGPVTVHVAQELRAQRARLQMSYDELAERSGVSKPTVIGCLKGERTIALEVYVLLCRALDLDPVTLIGQASRAARRPTSDTPPDWLALAANTDPSPTDAQRFEAEMGDWEPS